MALPPSSGAGAPDSALLSPMPDILYQTRISNGVQDSSTPHEMTLALSPGAFHCLARAPALRDAVTVVLRRFDGRPVELYKDGAMQTVSLSPAMFSFQLLPSQRALVVELHRKHLPVSSSHSEAPFMLVFCLPTPGGLELVRTNAFVIGSKEPKAAAARGPPKRVRAPCAKLPTTGPPSAFDEAVSAAFSGARGRKRGREEPAGPAVPRPGSVAGSDVSDVGAASEGEEGGGPSPPKRPAALPEPPALEEGGFRDLYALAALPPPPPLRQVSNDSLLSLSAPSALPAMPDSLSVGASRAPFDWSAATPGQGQFQFGLL